MFTRSLLSLMDKAESPRAVRLLDWLLTKSTGFSLSSPQDWYARNGYYQIAERGYGFSTYTGSSITRDRALDITALYAGIKIISEDLGTLPFHLYRKSSDRRSTDKAYDHPLYKTLHSMANPEIGANSFVKALTAHAILIGNGFAQVQRFSGGVYLWPWQPGDVRIDRNANGSLFYIHKEGNSVEKTFRREDVFNLVGFTLDGIHGESLMKRARHVLGIAEAADQYAGSFFKNGSAPGIVLNFPVGIKYNAEQVAAIKAKWKEWHQGPGRAHEPAVMQDGGTISHLGTDNDKAQLMQTRLYQLREVARILRIPLHMLGDMERSTNNNIEHQGIEYGKYTLSPWIGAWKSAVYMCLLTQREQNDQLLYAEHDLAGLLRGDWNAQSEGFRKMLEKGVYSINEVREFLGLNPTEGGDEHFIQLNLSTVQDVAAGANLMPVKGIDAPREVERIFSELAKEMKGYRAEIESLKGALTQSPSPVINLHPPAITIEAPPAPQVNLSLQRNTIVHHDENGRIKHVDTMRRVSIEDRPLVETRQ